MPEDVPDLHHGASLHLGVNLVLRGQLGDCTDFEDAIRIEAEIGGMPLQGLRGVGSFTGELHQIGLIDRLYPPDQLMDAVFQYIEDLATKAAPLSLKTMKFQVYRHMNMSLGEAMKESDRLMAASTAHDDFKEGVASFLQRRPPRFEKIG